jgi:hypothetical protein
LFRDRRAISSEFAQGRELCTSSRGITTARSYFGELL